MTTDLLRIGSLVCVLIGVTFGDTIQPAGSGVWVGGWAPTNGGNYFWDHQSGDGTFCNVGYLLASQGNPCGVPLNPLPGNLPFWAANQAGTAPVSDFYFSPSTPDHTVQLELELAGSAGLNQLYLYFRNGAPSQLLFNGPDSAPKTVSISVVGDFGFYFIYNGSGPTYYTESSKNVGEPDLQHFALFREEPTGTSGYDVNTYWLGIEDEPLTVSDQDYQDMLVRVQVGVVPEPAPLLLFCTSLLCLPVLRRFTPPANNPRRALLRAGGSHHSVCRE